MTDMDLRDHVANLYSAWGHSRESWLLSPAARALLNTQAAIHLLWRRVPDDAVRDEMDRPLNGGHIAGALLRGARP